MRVVGRVVGGPCFKRILVKIFPPGNEHPKKQLFRAPPGKMLTPQGVESVLSQTANNIEQRWFPGHDYRCVPVGPGEFNFIHDDECKKCVDEKRVALCHASDELLTESLIAESA